MSLLEKLNLYLKVFYFSGFAPYISPSLVTKQHIRSQSLLSKLPCILLFIFSFAVEMLSVWLINFPERLSYKAVERIIANLFIICDTIKIFSIFIPICFYNQTVTRIFLNFDGIHTYFQDILQWQINYDYFRKRFTRKFIFVQISYWQSVIFFLLDHMLNRGFDSSAFAFKLWQMASLLAFCHVMFYIDLLRHYLYQLNLSMKNATSDQIVDQNRNFVSNKPLKGVKELLIQSTVNKYKTIYYRLWDISQKINNVFGWTIAALFLQAFADGTYCIFWVYYAICDGKGTLEILRKNSMLTFIDNNVITTTL